MTVSSPLPIVLILTPVFGMLVVYLVGLTKSRYGREVITLLFLAATIAQAVNIGLQVLQGKTFIAAGQAFLVDGLSALMLLLVAIMMFLIVVQSTRYIQRELSLGAFTEGRVTLYYCLLLLFTATMSWTVTTNHLVMLYVAMEASTLATALLVAFYRKRPSLEAGYKYVLLVVVGMTFSLFGIVLIFAAAVPHLPTGTHALLLTEIGKVAREVSRTVALLGVAFMTAGFATKAGLVPFHAWLPDAHAEAPTPVSALLSGLVIKIGAYAIARTVTIFAPHYHAIVVFIAILTSFSMFIGIIMALIQDDLKRMLAYSSVSQISYVFEGLGLGTYLGIYGGLFHLINHTIVKALLFLSVGAIMYATNGLRRISQLGGLAKKMPITAFCFVVGALAIGGLPPFNGFMSKFTIFLAIGEQGLYWAMVVSVVTGLLTIACLVWAAYRVFWRQPAVEVAPANPGELREVPFLMWFSIVVLALACIAIGLYPQMLHPLLDRATRAILAIWGRV